MTIHQKLDYIMENAKGSKIINLGIGTSFDVSYYENFREFTIDNFIVGAISGDNPGLGSKTGNSCCAKAVGFNITKSYDINNGVLTINGSEQRVGSVDGTYTTQWNTYVTQKMTCFAYLIL